LPPPVSLIPRVGRLLEPLVLVLREPIERDVRDDVLPIAAPEEPPASTVSNSSSSLPDGMFSVHSLIWSLRLLSYSLIWLRRDQRKTPAPTAAAAVAAAAIGRSRALSIQLLLYWFRPSGLLFRRPR